MITDANETEYQATLHPELCAINPGKPFTFTERSYLLPHGDDEFKNYLAKWVRPAAHDGYAESWLG
ncbi:hypothetical protein ACIRPX_36620 [Streptomyces sp. NPDC101225]|uniref:hypothetical protein n=1 Tax=Streptomyces sp. NPDC101225 TaxID=3366135 RepID=UPI003804D7CB